MCIKLNHDQNINTEKKNQHLNTPNLIFKSIFLRDVLGNIFVVFSVIGKTMNKLNVFFCI